MTTTVANTQARTVPTTDQLIALAKELRPVLAERAATAEKERQLPEETIAALKDGGFFTHFASKHWGGSGGGLAGQVEISAELGKGCPSTAWLFTVLSGQLAMVPHIWGEEGAREVLGSADVPIVCCVNGFLGTARQTSEGYVVSGSWGFASGSSHADWFWGGVLVLDDNGDMIQPAFVLIPMSEVTIKDTWHVAGMRGTCSNTVVAKDVVVPARLVSMAADRAAREANPQPGDVLLDRLPGAAFMSPGLVGPLLGAAEGAYELVAANMPTRGVSYFDFNKQTDSAVYVQALGEARLKIDSAWLHIRRAMETLESVMDDAPLGYAERARCRADAGHAVENLRAAMEILLNIGGASSFADSNPLQRYWRDIEVSSRHAFLNSTLMYEAYSRAELGLDTNITPYI